MLMGERAPLALPERRVWRQNESMCGRYVMSKATGDLLSHFEAKAIEGSPPPPSWNVAPTQDVPIITTIPLKPSPATEQNKAVLRMAMWLT
jgi:putative SOS response-associated peptidase YedK